MHLAHLPSPRVPLSLTVGGLKSPWKGEYKEPRPPPQDQTTCHQTLRTPPRENPPAKANTDGTSEPQPPLPPEPPEPSKAPALNLSKEESGTWEPLPLSSLDPAPAKGPSLPDRRATFPELELQQLEIGGRSAVATPLPRPCPDPAPTRPGQLWQAVQWVPWEPSNSSSPSHCLPLPGFRCRTVSQQPVPAVFSGGTGTDSLLPQHRQPLPVRRQ